MRERIRIAGQIISQDYFEILLNHCIEANNEEDLSFFELLTTIAFLAFSQNEADWTILEVGLGGRLDSTNVVTKSHLSIITPISMDHEDFLGNSLIKIASEKAGILKPGTTVIFAKQNRNVLQVLKERSQKLDCATITQNEDFHVEPINSSFLFSNSKKNLTLPMPKLTGVHQVDNAGVAIMALYKLGCSDQNVSDAITKVHWPGRLQKITKGKLSPSNLGFTAELFLDGGHNPAAGAAIATWIKQLKPSTFFLILGIMKNKNLQGFLAPFGSSIHKLIAVNIPEEINAQDRETIAQTATRMEIPSVVASDIKSALQNIKAEKPILPKRILITGSLYLVGHFLKQNSAEFL